MATINEIPTSLQEPKESLNAQAIAVHELHKSFDGRVVLNGITLMVKRGETLAVLGRSGTGKSVLLRLIIGLDVPDSGSICVHGSDIDGLSLDQMGEIRKKMGFLFQQAALYDSLTVGENVAFPLEHHRRDLSKSERDDRVRQLLDEVGLEDASTKMPDILLLDEPTAGLDPISSGEIDDLVLKLQRERQMASIVVTHDMHSAKTIANRLALLDKGDVVIEGRFEDLERSDIEFVKEFLKQT
jgi:phospholipid/cholesterol/gamma-HCH transport system ATP-binding protein